MSAPVVVVKDGRRTEYEVVAVKRQKAPLTRRSRRSGPVVVTIVPKEKP